MQDCFKSTFDWKSFLKALTNHEHHKIFTCPNAIQVHYKVFTGEMKVGQTRIKEQEHKCK